MIQVHFRMILVFFVFSAMPALGFSAEVGQAAPAFTLTDVYGKQHSLSDFKGKFVVLEWFNSQCPFVQKFYKAGEMQKLQKKYGLSLEV